jgi:hypothetical protein
MKSSSIPDLEYGSERLLLNPPPEKMLAVEESTYS